MQFRYEKNKEKQVLHEQAEELLLEIKKSIFLNLHKIDETLRKKIDNIRKSWVAWLTMEKKV